MAICEKMGVSFMKSTFCFSKELQIVLYGVNHYSEKLYGSLTDAGYTVAAYFDQRYAELEGKYPVPVYSLKNHPFTNRDKTNFCVVIMLQNAMQHESIAMEFLRQGFHKILFVPMESMLRETTALALRYQYNILLSGQFQLLQEIPFFEENALQSETDAAFSTIRDEKNFRIIWCPAELVYTNPPRVCNKPATLRYANVPLYSYLPYVSLFEYLQGEGGEKQQYLNEYGVNSCAYTNSLTDAKVLLQRRELLEIYKNALNKGMDFFISSAPPAEWNEEFKVFNLLEGQHRSLFLVMQEFRYIPIRISQSDYKKWEYRCEDANLQNYLKKHADRFPVLHPQYHKISETANRNDLLQLKSIQKYLSSRQNSCRELLEGKTVLDLSGTYGYYARNALRMRAESAVLYAPKGKSVAREVNALEGFPSLCTVDDWSEAAHKTYHTLFVLKALSDMSLDEKKVWIDRCGGLCREECFITAQNPAELQLWSRWFSKVQELRTLFDQGQIVKLYVLRK